MPAHHRTARPDSAAVAVGLSATIAIVLSGLIAGFMHYWGGWPVASTWLIAGLILGAVSGTVVGFVTWRRGH